MEMTRNNVFFSVDCWWLWKQPVSVTRCSKWCHLLILPSCLQLHATAFSIDQLLHLWRFVNFVIMLPTCQWGAALSRWSQGLVWCTHVPASLHKFFSQPDCLADTDLKKWSPVFPAKGTGLFHEQRVTSAPDRTCHFRHSYLKANKVSKSEGSRKVEHACHFFIARQHTDARYWYSKSIWLSVCPSVRPSVRPLRSGTIWKRFNISS